MKKVFRLSLVPALFFLALMAVPALADDGNATAVPTIEATPAVTVQPDSGTPTATVEPGLTPPVFADKSARGGVVARRPVVTVVANARERVQAARERVQEAKQRIEDRAVRVNELRSRAKSLNSIEKAELRTHVLESLQNGFDQRISLAGSMEEKGADSVLVSGFVAFANAQKERFSQATTNAERKTLIVEFNKKWRDFVRDVAKKTVSKKVQQRIAQSKELLAKLDGAIARLKANGTGVARLEDISAKVAARIDAASQNDITVRQAAWRLASVHRGLVHLRNSIMRAARGQAVEPIAAEAEPSGLSSPGEATVEAPADVAGQQPAATPVSTTAPSASPDAAAPSGTPAPTQEPEVPTSPATPSGQPTPVPSAS